MIDHYLQGKDSIFLLPTWGVKSVCYQLPALLNQGQTIVISPLVSLMQVQVYELNQRGIKSMFFENIGGKNDLYRQLENARNGNFKIIYFSPERLASYEFLNQIEKLPIKGIAVDEAHCISEWGHDFRPEYRKIRPFIKQIADVHTIALTATATPKVQDDIIKNLKLDYKKADKSLELRNE